MSQEVRNNPRRDAGGRKGGQFKEVQKEYKEELLEIARVTRVTAGGRQLRFRAAVVIGNEKGTVGLGTGKAGEVVVAIEKAFRDAKKNLVTFPIAGNTLPHDVVANYKATSVFLHPAHEGTGIIAGGAIRKLMFVSGLKDVIAKRQGGGNSLTSIRATLKALSMIKNAASNPFLSKAKAEATPAKDASETATAPAPKAKAPAKKKSA